MTAESKESLLLWLNQSFACSLENNINSFLDLSDTFLFEKILLEIDYTFFSGLALSPNEGLASKKYNLNCIFKRIKGFYREKLNISVEEIFQNFDSKKAIENKSELEFQKLIELLAGITAQCDRREYYLNIMQNMEEQHSSELLSILTDKLTKYIEGVNEENNYNFLDDLSKSINSEEILLDEKLKLTEKIEALELDKNILNEKLVRLNENNLMLNIEKDLSQKKYKDLEEKYDLLIDSMNYEKNKKAQKDKNEDLNLAIKVSELTGVLEGKEKSFARYKQEKEDFIFNMKQEKQLIKDEMEILKEVKIKNDYLEEKLKKLNFEESNRYFYKEKISYCEKKILELEEQNKKLKNYDIDKIKLLEKAENLTKELTTLKSENDILNREIQNYVKQLSAFSGDANLHSNMDKGLILQGYSSANLIEIKTKLETLREENSEIKKEKKELEELVEKLNDDLNNSNKLCGRLKSKEEKYEKTKEENKQNVSKLAQLMEDNHKLKDQLNSMKIQEKKITQELETKLINEINNLSQKHSEEIYSLKDSIIRLENENKFLKIDLKKSEDIIEANKQYLNNLNHNEDTKDLNGNTKSNNAHSQEDRLSQLEHTLKEILKTESDEHKKIIQEKNEKIEELNLKIKNLEMLLKKVSKELESLNLKSYELTVEEIQKRDEIINFLTTEFENKNRIFEEEQKMISNLFHKLGYEYACMVADSHNLNNKQNL